MTKLDVMKLPIYISANSMRSEIIKKSLNLKMYNEKAYVYFMLLTLKSAKSQTIHFGWNTFETGDLVITFQISTRFIVEYAIFM